MNMNMNMKNMKNMKNENIRFVKKNLFSLIAKSILIVLAPSISMAQQPNVPINNNEKKVENVISTNPFGSVKTNDSNNVNINYSNTGNNLNNPKKLNTNINEINNNIPNPLLAQEQTMGSPKTPPEGLPQSYNMEPQQKFQPGAIDPTESTMNILNTPEEKIRQLNKDLYRKGRVINEGPVNTPKSNNGMLVAHLSPGSTSPVIRLFKNRTSTLIVTDMSGQPWPILNYDGLTEEDFSVKRLDNPSPNGYVLSITPKGSFVSGNLVLILKGLPTPLNIEFISAQKEVDVSTEIRVQAAGPNSQYLSIGLPTNLDNTLLSVLQGVAPKDSKELNVSTNAVQVWGNKDGYMYVRTRYKIMSPAFENVTSSPDGTYAYKMIYVPVVLYKVEDGRFGEFTIEGF